MVFRVGQKCVCVDDRPCRADGVAELVKGDVYTIRWSGIGPSGHPCVRVEEIYRDDATTAELLGVNNNIDCPFRAARFRPVVSTDTGMAVLEQIRRDVTNKILRPIFEDEQA